MISFLVFLKTDNLIIKFIWKKQARLSTKKTRKRATGLILPDIKTYNFYNQDSVALKHDQIK